MSRKGEQRKQKIETVLKAAEERQVREDRAVRKAMDVPGVYSEDELRSLFKLVDSLPKGGRVLEIGVLYGRSSTVLFELAREKELQLEFVDPFVVDGKDAMPRFMEGLRESGVPAKVHCMTSKEYEKKETGSELFDLVHVDGDHSPEGINVDCDLVVSLIAVGGFAVFHDYEARALEEDGGELVFPQIKEAVDQWLDGAGWAEVARVDSQIAFRREAP
jgi:predicted O-methyltransferase YrrM